MHYFFALSGIFAVVFGLIALVSATQYQVSTDVEQAQMLEAHLATREKVFSPASDMLLMVRTLNFLMP